MIKIDENIELSQKLCTKMSHDLSGASMSIQNSIELLSDDDFKDTATDIAKRGALSIAAKIRIFRIAFGTPGSDLGGDEMLKIIENYLSSVSPKSSLVQSKMEIDINTTRILFNILIYFFDCLNSKAEVKIGKFDDMVALFITNSKKIIIKEDIEIKDNEIHFKELTSNNSPLYLSKVIAEKEKRKIKIEINENLLKLMIE